MSNLDSYAGRVAYCVALLALREGVTHIRQEELSGRIERITETRYPQQTIGRWLKRAPRDFDDQVAFAEVLGADPGWLYFGPRHSKAPAPMILHLSDLHLEPGARDTPATQAVSGASELLDDLDASEERRRRRDAG